MSQHCNEVYGEHHSACWKKINKVLPGRFTVVFHCWTTSSLHYVSVFALYPSSNENGYSKTVLAISRIEDETSQSAQDHNRLLRFVLLVCNRRVSHIVALTRDNTSTHWAFSPLISPIYIGCYSHRLNLAVKEFQSDHQLVMYRIQTHMRKLSSCFTFAQLQSLTSLQPIMAKIKRWSSKFFMLKQYSELKKDLCEIDNSQIHDLLLSTEKEAEL